MRIWSDTFEEQGALPSRCALCRIDLGRRVIFAENRNPHLAWTGLPDNTRSLVLLCVDQDAPSQTERVNQVGEVVPVSLPRVDFFHWVLVDIPPGRHGVGEGEFSDGITLRGKHRREGPSGCRQGMNDYTDWFATDLDMQGEYFGYDGPCPPWNDVRPHRYVFTLYALDVPRLAVEGNFTGPQVLRAVQPHALARVSLSCRYTLNTDVAL